MFSQRRMQHIFQNQDPGTTKSNWRTPLPPNISKHITWLHKNQSNWINFQRKTWTKATFNHHNHQWDPHFFFVDKKDGKLRPCQDYQYLNEHTIKNAYPLSLISELLDKLKGARWFTKLDVQWGYNNVRVRDGDQWKVAFKMNRGLLNQQWCSLECVTHQCYDFKRL